MRRRVRALGFPRRPAESRRRSEYLARREARRPPPPPHQLMSDPYERYLADLASADGMPEASSAPDPVLLPDSAGDTAEG